MIPREGGLAEPLPETSTLRVYSATAPSPPSPSGVGAQCTLRAATRRPSTAITSSNDVVFVRDVAHDLLHEISWPTSASSQANTPPGTDDAWVRSPRPATHVSATYALQHVDRTLSHADYGPERCVGSHFEGSLGGHVPAATLTMYHPCIIASSTAYPPRADFQTSAGVLERMVSKAAWACCAVTRAWPTLSR